MVDDLVLLDRPNFGQTSKEQWSEPTEGAVEVERSTFSCSRRCPPHMLWRKISSSERMRPSLTCAQINQ